MPSCDAQKWGLLCGTRVDLNADLLVFLAAVTGIVIAICFAVIGRKGMAADLQPSPSQRKDKATPIFLGCVIFATVSQAILTARASEQVWFASLGTVALLLLALALTALFAILVLVAKEATHSKVVGLNWLLLTLSFGAKLEADISGHMPYSSAPYWVASGIALAGASILCLSTCVMQAFRPASTGAVDQQVGLFSTFTFNYLNPLLALGYKQRITWDDLPALAYRDSTEAASDTFGRAWLAQSTSGVDHSLLRALLTGFKQTYAQAIVFKFAADLFSLAQPQLLRLLMSYIQSADKRPVAGTAIPLAMFMASILQSLCIHQCFQRLSVTSVRVKSALHSTIYAKSLRLSNGARMARATGDIINHMAVDTQRLQDAVQFSQHFWSAPLQILLCLASLYQLLGASMLAGVVVMVLMLPINRYLSGFVKNFQKQQARNKDGRSKLTIEVVKMMKSIKLMSWDRFFMAKLQRIRDTQELQLLQKLGLLKALSEFTGAATPFLVACAGFSVFALTQDSPLTADIVFPAFALFHLLAAPLTVLPATVYSITDGAIAARRLTVFLSAEELQADAVTTAASPYAELGPIVIRNATFAWGSHESSNVLDNVNFTAYAGRVSCIVGRIGAGKTALLEAILGNLHKEAGSVFVYGSLAYVAQNHWILNATVRENIVFGHEWDAERYAATVEACALLDDFSALSDGDQTVVGDMGISLSGGQKARLSLARAVFSGADIYLFDDILAAVDAHVARHLIDKLLGPDGILKGKTIIMTTNSEAALAQADSVFLLQDGQVTEQPSSGAQEVSRSKSATVEEMHIPSRSNDRDSPQPIVASHPSGSKLPGGRSEGSQKGQVKSAVYVEYAKANSLFAVSVYAIALVASQCADIGSSVWLKYWGDTNKTAGDNANISMFIGIYVAFGVGSASLVLFQNIILWLVCSIRASRNLHAQMATSILHSPMSFFESTPAGQILNRFSSDLFRVDESLPRQFNSFFVNISKACFILGVISFGTPVFAAFIVPLTIFYIWMQRYYLGAKRELKRLDGSSRSPVFSHFHETLGGVSTVRAYGAETRFKHRVGQLVDANVQAYLASITANRWLGLRLEFIGANVVLLAAGFAVASQAFHSALSPGMAGLTVSYALQITQCLGSLVRASGELETNIVSVERILEYTNLPSEGADIVPGHTPPASWISKGDIDFVDYNARYRPDFEPVLKNITLSVKARESIGVVGRTGAGKSSLAMALFRIIEPFHGQINIDNLNTSAMGLRSLRERLTIIPQDACLFEGTIRENIDPEEIYDDTQLWNALEYSQLKQHVATMNGGLDAVISEGGGNLSQGQRQLVSLARALLRDSRVLLLDEATAAVDIETEKAIQSALRQTFRGRATVITIAHRISTIMDSDRVVVLDKGRVVEFDTPAALLSRKGVFHSLATEAGLVTEST